MNKSILLLIIFTSVLFSLIVAGQTVEAQFLGSVYINPDGSVAGTSNIQRNGNLYTLTGNISGGIQVQKSGIIIDGAGYAVQGNGTGRGIDLSNGRGQDPSRPEVSNVTVKNLRILNFYYGVDNVNTHSNTFIGNYIENGENSFSMGGYHNIIAYNTMNNASIAINFAGSNYITKNNFINCWVMVWLSTEPIVDENYWSDYTTRYPDAKEIDNTGIWDTPYAYWENTIDSHPLVNPVNISDFEIPPIPDIWSPAVSIVSPENKTYTVNNIQLTFRVSEPTSWMGYSLDGKANVTITGNTTLTGLLDGPHSLTVYASDAAGNTGSSNMVYFTITTTVPRISIL